MALLEKHKVDFVVLARYMQILSGEFLERVGVPLINIHHSFLPAFAGADPYAQAMERSLATPMIKPFLPAMRPWAPLIKPTPLANANIGGQTRPGRSIWEVCGRIDQKVKIEMGVPRHVYSMA